MKKIYFLFLAVFILSGTSAFAQATTFCNPNGNVIIYSNYDGGPLTINVDQNIPNLKIGIVSYEFARIVITGTYAANVTEVRWAGYNAANNHCSLSAPLYTTISGVPNNVDTIITIPPANYSNPNGYGFIICNYSCDNTTNQGGCNTPDQIVDYFLAAFGGTNTSLYYHHTQYGCWSGTYNVSAGGNCCIVPITTSITENNAGENNWSVTPNPSNGDFHISLPEGISKGEIKIYNVLGEEVRAQEISGAVTISLAGEISGIYFMKLITAAGTYSKRIVLSE